MRTYQHSEEKQERSAGRGPPGVGTKFQLYCGAVVDAVAAFLETKFRYMAGRVFF